MFPSVESSHPGTKTGMKTRRPKEACALIQQEPGALFVDGRMEVESMYGGRPPGVHMIAWYEYPNRAPDPQQLVKAVEREAGAKSRTVILICRSGKRSVTFRRDD
mgnify:CR=1 FL=1